MKRLCTVLFLVMLLVMALSATALAATDYTFFLSAPDTSSAKVGDEITVSLTLKNNSNTAFTMYSMQDYVLYDTSSFSYVEGSASAANGLVVSTPTLSDSSKGAVRVSYLSMDGSGVACDASTVLLTFKLKVNITGTTTLSHYLAEMSSRTADLYAISTVDAALTIGSGGTTSGGTTSGSSGGGTTTTTVTDEASPYASTLGFADIQETAWYFGAVKFVVENGLFTGTTSTTFEPQTAMTRDMLVTVLYRLAGKPAVSATASAFPDVLSGSWYADAVNWATTNKIVTGYDNGNFGPKDPVTREQLMSILYRYSELKGYDVSASGDLSGFTDSGSIHDYALTPLKWATGNGLITGKSAGVLNPTGNATRAEVATILMRFVDLVK